MRANPECAHFSIDLDDDSGDNLVVIVPEDGNGAAERESRCICAMCDDSLIVVTRTDESARLVRAILDAETRRYEREQAEPLVAILLDE